MHSLYKLLLLWSLNFDTETSNDFMTVDVCNVTKIFVKYYNLVILHSSSLAASVIGRLVSFGMVTCFSDGLCHMCVHR